MLVSAGPSPGQNFSAEVHGAEGKTWTGIVRLVRAGDQIVFDPQSLKQPENTISVAWRQRLRSRKANYAHTAAAIKTAGVNEVLSIFVEKARLNDFLAKCATGQNGLCTLKAGPEFQYGRSLTGAFRLLVYHDKTSRPFSRRFMGDKTLTSFRRTARGLASKLNTSALAVPIAFTAANYVKNYALVMFGNSGSMGNSLRSLRSGAAASQASFDRLPHREKIALVSSRSHGCNQQVVNLFRQGNAAAKTHYLRKCRQWTRAQWGKLAGNPGRQVGPGDFGNIERKWRHCMANAKALQGHRRQGEMNCDMEHKLALLAIGADPSVHYDYGSGAVFRQFVASGKWRLK
ncbi:MAG: hypothetical protein C0605_03920 [Hyphomicrobiales bacterium]|nr:MAG: hypothetical protein C0605_03920 [Hyphomicrobiales bacterium]